MHKKLPHISLEDYYQFITFRTHDSYDNYAKNILGKNISNKTKEWTFKIVQYIKGKSSLILNKYLNKKGRFWHENYYDMKNILL